MFCWLSGVFDCAVCIVAGWLWPAGRRCVAVRVPGQLCHALALIPVSVRGQPDHHPGHCGDDHRLSGMSGRYQGKQMSAPQCEFLAVTST